MKALGALERLTKAYGAVRVTHATGAVPAGGPFGVALPTISGPDSWYYGASLDDAAQICISVLLDGAERAAADASAQAEELRIKLGLGRST